MAITQTLSLHRNVLPKPSPVIVSLFLSTLASATRLRKARSRSTLIAEKWLECGSLIIFGGAEFKHISIIFCNGFYMGCDIRPDLVFLETWRQPRVDLSQTLSQTRFIYSFICILLLYLFNLIIARISKCER